MSSPTAARTPVPRGAFLLLQDEPPLAPKGHNALASLIRHRGREDEDNAGDGAEDELPRRDERRMSALLNSSHMRSMRLIGNSNPRYRWERYWKTDSELAAMPRNLCVPITKETDLTRAWLTSADLMPRRLQPPVPRARQLLGPAVPVH